VARDHRLDHRAAAAERDRSELEVLRQPTARRTGSTALPEAVMRIAVILVVAAADQLDQLLHGFGWHRRMHDDDVRCRRDAVMAYQVLERIVGQRLVEAAVVTVVWL